MLPCASRSLSRVPKVVYDYSLPSVVLVSYLRLFGLVRERPETPPLDFEGQVVPLLGVSKTQARQHIRDLRLARLLTWRLDPGGKYVFCFYRISEPQIGFPDSEEEDEEISPDLNKPKIHHQHLLPESGFPETENRDPGAISVASRGERMPGGEARPLATAAQVEPEEAELGGPDNAPGRPGERVAGWPVVPKLPGRTGAAPEVQSLSPGGPPKYPASPPAAPGLVTGTPAAPEPPLPAVNLPGRPGSAPDIPPVIFPDAHSQLDEPSQGKALPQARPQLQPEWREIPAKPPSNGLPRPRPTHALQPTAAPPGQTRLLSLDAEGRLPSQFNLLIQDPRFSQVMAWLTRSGVWTDTAVRLSRQVLENELRAAPYTPTRADVLGWITFCFAFRSENKISRSSSVLAGNLDANRCCPDELRPKPICLGCRFTADYCECAEGPHADYPPEFFDYAMINAYTPEVEDYWGVCPTCHHYGCLCVERGYAEVAEEEAELDDYFNDEDEDYEEDDEDTEP